MQGNTMYPVQNTMIPTQQRLMQMTNQYPQYMNNQYQMQPFMQQQQGQAQTNYIKCRAVTNQDEASAAMIDLDGTLNVFIDISNNAIYTKQVNLDGTAPLVKYVREDVQKAVVPQTIPTIQTTATEIPAIAYVERRELDDLVNQVHDVMNNQKKEIDELKELINKSGGNTNGKSNGNAGK